MAGRKMAVVPVSLSIFVSWMSAISFLADPVEMYTYGTVYLWIGIGYVLGLPHVAHIFIPIYFRIKMISVYQVRYFCNNVLL